MDTPLSTTQSILAATQSDPSLRYDKNLISNYLNLGGTLMNGAIPTISSEPVTPKKTVSILSTENAKQDVNTNLNTLNGISPTTSPSYVPTKVETPKIETKTPTKTDTENSTFINKDTGQEYTFNSLDLENPTNQSYIKQNGLDFVSGRFPSFLAQPNTQSAGDKLSEDVAAKDKQLEDLTNQWLSYDVEADPVFKARASSITAQYDELKRAMAKQNESRMKAYQTLGIRSGTSQYASGVQMGIEGEELNQANQRIATLNREEADAISSARQAYQTGKWTEFSNKVNALQKIRDNKSEELKNYNEALAKNVKAIQDATDAANKKIYDEVTKPKNDILTELGKVGGVPKEVIDAVTSSKTLSEAITSAGDYLQTMSGDYAGYPTYRNSMHAKGLVPLDPLEWKDQEDAKKIKQKANEAYASKNAQNEADANNGVSDKVQQKLEQQYRQVLSKEFSARTGALGVENSKVNQANHLNSLFTQYYDPKTGNYNIPKTQYAELAMGLANLVAPSGTVTEGAREAILQKTAKGNLNGALAYITGVPQNGSTQEVFKNLIDSVDRQAQTAIKNREVALQNMRDQAPTDLDPARVEKLNKSTEMVKYDGQDRISKGAVDTYVKNHPAEKENIAKLYEVPGATNEIIEAYLQAQGKI